MFVWGVIENQIDYVNFQPVITLCYKSKSMLKPFLLLAVVFVFGVHLRAQYPDEPPMNPISPTEYQYHFWKLQLKYGRYFQGHQSEISLPRNHNSNHEYKSRDCDLILTDMKLLVTPKQKGNCWIFQFDKKAKKKCG